jgi:hypothetical protein
VAVGSWSFRMLDFWKLMNSYDGMLSGRGADEMKSYVRFFDRIYRIFVGFV